MKTRRSSIRILFAVCLIVGVACLAATTARATDRSYTVYATDGYVTMADGTKMYMFGFNDTGVQGQIQFPAPLVWANVGETVSFKLVNLGFKYRPDLTDPHTIHLHGMHVTPYFDGFPEGSFGIPMGSSFTYTFMPSHEGSFMYHCHVEAVEHVQMGMYGPLVIYSGPPKKAYGQGYTKEYIWMLSEVDSRWHHSLEPGAVEIDIPEALQTYPPSDPAEWLRVNYRPDYWLINGLGFPDSIRTGAQLPILTYDADGALAGIQAGIAVANGNPSHNGLQQSALLDVVADESVLVRLINIGYEAHPMHLHGEDFDLLASDGNPLPHLQSTGRRGETAKYEKFTINIASGESYDALVDFDSVHLCQNLSTVPAGGVSPFPSETSPLYDPNGPLFFPAHCHDDYHVTNQGVYPGGMTTLVKVARPVCAP